MPKKIRCKIFSFQDGVVEYANVKLVRIQSKDNNLLIMEDHLPVLGEVNGKIEIVSDEECITLTDVHGYYMHRNNEFKLVMKV